MYFHSFHTAVRMCRANQCLHLILNLASRTCHHLSCTLPEDGAAFEAAAMHTPTSARPNSGHFSPAAAAAAEAAAPAAAPAVASEPAPLAS
jgi:hypothetical protein